MARRTLKQTLEGIKSGTPSSSTNTTTTTDPPKQSAGGSIPVHNSSASETSPVPVWSGFYKDKSGTVFNTTLPSGYIDGTQFTTTKASYTFDNVESSEIEYDGIYYPNDKKLHGANLEVLYKLDKIEFSSYSDGGLKQYIAYLKFYNDTNIVRTKLEEDYLNNVVIDSEQIKCLEVSENCEYSFEDTVSVDEVDSDPFKEVSVDEYEDLSNITFGDTAQLPDSVTNLEFDNSEWMKSYYDYDNLYINKADLPAEIRSFLPEFPKEISNAIDNAQQFKNQAQEFVNKGIEFINKTPLGNIGFIQDAIGIVKSIFGFADKILNTANNVKNKYNNVVNTVEDVIQFLKGFSGPPEELEEFTGIYVPSETDEPIAISPDTYVPEFQGDLSISDEDTFAPDLNISLTEPVLSADLLPPIDAITTYDCSKMLAKDVGIWQFLFNPSELQYSYRPEYAGSDTWATTDGKPLHWKGNSNVKLSFRNIILNGYMFGRKVDSLAQGLKDLVAYTQNPYQYLGSPPVLQFVWGNKTFGPCVMQDLNITEKGWDGGELVIAECSFTLERVPEWIVNDGEVDIFDPSKSPTFIPTITETTTTEVPPETSEEVVTTPSSDPVVEPGVVTGSTQNPTQPTAPAQSSELCPYLAANISQLKNLIANINDARKVNYKTTDEQDNGIASVISARLGGFKKFIQNPSVPDTYTNFKKIMASAAPRSCPKTSTGEAYIPILSGSAFKADKHIRVVSNAVFKKRQMAAICYLDVLTKITQTNCQNRKPQQTSVRDPFNAPKTPKGTIDICGYKKTGKQLENDIYWAIKKFNLILMSLPVTPSLKPKKRRLEDLFNDQFIPIYNNIKSFNTVIYSNMLSALNTAGGFQDIEKQIKDATPSTFDKSSCKKLYSDLSSGSYNNQIKTDTVPKGTVPLLEAVQKCGRFIERQIDRIPC